MRNEYCERCEDRFYVEPDATRCPECGMDFEESAALYEGRFYAHCQQCGKMARCLRGITGEALCMDCE